MIKLLAIYTGLFALVTTIAFVIVLVQLNDQLMVAAKILNPLLGK